jgi:hypothetical protein
MSFGNSTPLCFGIRAVKLRQQLFVGYVALNTKTIDDPSSTDCVFCALCMTSIFSFTCITIQLLQFKPKNTHSCIRFIIIL